MCTFEGSRVENALDETRSVMSHAEDAHLMDFHYHAGHGLQRVWKKVKELSK
jgi:hypothetical protein